MIGSGGLVVMDEDNCMVEVARFFMNFTQNESCGSASPAARVRCGCSRYWNASLQARGKEDLDMLEELADMIARDRIAAFGKTAPSPVISTMKYFGTNILRMLWIKNVRRRTARQ